MTDLMTTDGVTQLSTPPNLYLIFLFFRSAASPRVRELAQRALSPATRVVGGHGSPHSVHYTGSPVRQATSQSVIRLYFGSISSVFFSPAKLFSWVPGTRFRIMSVLRSALQALSNKEELESSAVEPG
jgi:hypothetical protein